MEAEADEERYGESFETGFNGPFTFTRALKLHSEDDDFGQPGTRRALDAAQ